MENIQNLVTVIEALRWIIAAPFVTLGAIALWGWWQGMSV